MYFKAYDINYVLIEKENQYETVTSLYTTVFN